jgi:23S rRNA (guanosine2251-2'-O)-methyltransferase
MSVNKASHSYIYGIHPILAILTQNPERILNLYIQLGRQDQRIQEIIQIAQQHGIAIHQQASAKLIALTNSQHTQGVVAQCRKVREYTETDLEHLLETRHKAPFLLILDEVQDPHNLGACLRSANAAGVDAVIAPKHHAAQLTPTVSKIASGAAEVTPFISVTNLARTMRALKEKGIWLLGASADASKSIYQADLSGSIALVMGAEGKGLRRLTQEQCDDLLSIPMAGTVASLNVSVAAGICLFEAVRQRLS